MSDFNVRSVSKVTATACFRVEMKEHSVRISLMLNRAFLLAADEMTSRWIGCHLCEKSRIAEGLITFPLPRK
ncbi:hypothetical protein CEXT_159481 [Caerostris extrusa]|uniref:Uncharacterized protein n=1 Tax=Caerostris extrusa TaxID=172846 RepID=A0AAV4T2H2_CAEEX|nr:hypothetical protein CEXT_159481 [Caerostris extrusa]